MGAPIYDVLTLRENEDFSRTWNVTNGGVPVDFSTATSAQLMIRADVGDAAPVKTLSLGGGITLDALGNITIALTASECSTLATVGLALRLRGTFNCIIADAAGKKKDYAEGIVQIRRSPTR